MWIVAEEKPNVKWALWITFFKATSGILCSQLFFNFEQMENDTQMNQSMHQTSKIHSAHSMLQKSIFFLLIAIVLFLAFWLVSTYIFPRQSKGFQAVFLSNGQVYYGHLQKNISRDYVKLNDIYYLQFSDGTSDTSETTDTTQSQDFALIKLGQELHGPKDTMLINKDHILFIEDLRENSDLVKTILDFES